MVRFSLRLMRSINCLIHSSAPDNKHTLKQNMTRGTMHVQVLACFGVSDKSALLDHMSVGETMHLIHVRVYLDDPWLIYKRSKLCVALLMTRRSY